ncbi:MAG: hypothetical protein KC912_16660 [Proteobacteria bacterium]|nr:hypothetical protein [Pseudomonadota bacterium]
MSAGIQPKDIPLRTYAVASFALLTLSTSAFAQDDATLRAVVEEQQTQVQEIEVIRANATRASAERGGVKSQLETAVGDISDLWGSLASLEVLIEKDLEKQRQEILKNLERTGLVETQITELTEVFEAFKREPRPDEVDTISTRIMDRYVVGPSGFYEAEEVYSMERLGDPALAGDKDGVSFLDLAAFDAMNPETKTACVTLLDFEGVETSQQVCNSDLVSEEELEAKGAIGVPALVLMAMTEGSPRRSCRGRGMARMGVCF